MTDISMFIGDSPAVDAFSRLRVPAPAYVFDQQLTYDLAPLIYEQLVSGSGASIAHNTANRSALFTFSATGAGGTAYMQTFECFRYQPGRSQQAIITFNFIETAANTLKFAGYSDGVNGIELQQDGSTVQLKLYSGTTQGSQTVAQAAWNIDPMDGTGPSGITLDLTKDQILRH